jgi:hypothetical protein
MGGNEGVKQAEKQQRAKQQIKKIPSTLTRESTSFQLDRTLLGSFPVKSEVIPI